MSCSVNILSSYVMFSFPVCCHTSKQRKSDSQPNRCSNTEYTHIHFLAFPHQNPQNLQTTSLWEFPLILYFAYSPLPSQPLGLFWDFHSLAQTALALTPGHPMLSLSNYLTNRSETALISAYCSALLNAASLGGLSGKLWYGDQQARQADKGEQHHCAVRSQRPQRHIRQSEQPPSGLFQLVMGLLNASLKLCSLYKGGVIG